MCSITSISPSSGSLNGGTLITISGSNFSPSYSDTLVYVGDELNWFCRIETITTTQITCRTPPIASSYLPGDNQRVVISTKLYSLSTCPGNNCNFIYLSQTASPNLTKISASSAAGAVQLTLNGSGFIVSTTCSVSLTSQANSSVVYAVPSDNCTNTSATFTVPRSVPSANYWVRVRN